MRKHFPKAVARAALARIRAQQSTPVTQPDANTHSFAKKRLLIDVTTTHGIPFVTGIQRVVMRITKEMLAISKDLPIEPVPVYLKFTGETHRLVRASEFEQKLGFVSVEEPIQIRTNDTILMLDSTWDIFAIYAHYVFPIIKARGGKVISCVYDLIPITHPQFCTTPLVAVFEQWVPMMLKNSDQIVCISKATADSVSQHAGAFKGSISHFHLGADFHTSSVIPPSTKQSNIPTVLMVGTVEPRKGHLTALDAFDTLWAGGKQIRLHIVGRNGWMIDDLFQRLHSHPKLGDLLLLDLDANDGALQEAYRSSDLVLSASIAEGFGLPLVEAAALGKSLLVSDIPVFREICGNAALYFKAGDAQELAATLGAWVDRRTAPTPPDVLSWSESAKQLLSLVQFN